MKPIYERIFAILLLCIPGVIAVYGWTLIRDALFYSFTSHTMTWGQFFIGGGLFILGLFTLVSFVFYRDRKRNWIRRPRRKNKITSTKPHT